MKQANLSRKQAATLIDTVARALLDEEEAPELMVSRIKNALVRAGIAPFEKCDGEAHNNPHQDHCSCLPRWGVIGPEIVVR